MGEIKTIKKGGLAKAREAFKKSYTPTPPSDELVNTVEEATRIMEEINSSSTPSKSNDDSIAAKEQRPKETTL